MGGRCTWCAYWPAGGCSASRLMGVLVLAEPRISALWCERLAFASMTVQCWRREESDLYLGVVDIPQSNDNKN